MTQWVHRFMVVPAANAATARTLAKQLADPPAADDMWSVGLNASGTGIPTHWISSGLIDAQFAALLGDASMTYAVYQSKGGTTITLADIQALYDACPLGSYIRDDAEGREQECIAALGLKLISAPL
jgi:hypothetical protein